MSPSTFLQMGFTVRPPTRAAISGRTFVAVGLFLAFSAVSTPAKPEDPATLKPGNPMTTLSPSAPPVASAATTVAPMRTIRLTRYFPGFGASGSTFFDLENNESRPLVAPQVDGQPAFNKEMVEAQGELDVTRPAGDVPPRGSVRLSLKFSGFSEAGEFVTGLTVRSSSLDKPQRIPIGVRVSDHWIYPWIVIFLGVAAAFGISQISERWRPLQENRYRALTLTGEVESTRRNTQLPTKLTALDSIRSKLELASNKIQMSDIQGSTTLLDDAEKEFQAFQAAETQQRTRIAQDLEALGAQAAALTRRNLPPEQVTIRDSVNQSVREATEALETDQLDQADALLAAIRQQLGQIPPPVVVAGLGIPLPPEPALELSDPSDTLTTDSTVGLALVFLGAQTRVGDEFDWEFGDGTFETTKEGARTRHRFKTAGAYTVKVSIRRGPGREEVASYHKRIVIRPTKNEMDLAALRREILVGEMLVSVFSLILASLTGLLSLYVKSPAYGSLQDYLTAFLWGFGIDGTLRGYAGVLKRMTSPNG